MNLVRLCAGTLCALGLRYDNICAECWPVAVSCNVSRKLSNISADSVAVRTCDPRFQQAGLKCRSPLHLMLTIRTRGPLARSCSRSDTQQARGWSLSRHSAPVRMARATSSVDVQLEQVGPLVDDAVVWANQHGLVSKCHKPPTVRAGAGGSLGTPAQARNVTHAERNIHSTHARLRYTLICTYASLSTPHRLPVSQHICAAFPAPSHMTPFSCPARLCMPQNPSANPYARTCCTTVT